MIRAGYKIERGRQFQFFDHRTQFIRSAECVTGTLDEKHGRANPSALHREDEVRSFGGREQPAGHRDRSLRTKSPADRARIACEELVRALAVEQDGDARLAGRAHHAPLRIDAGRAERLALAPDDALEIFEQLVCRRQDLVMFGAERVALGSDYPFPLGEAHPGELIESLKLGAKENAQLFSGNARDFLGINP